MAGLYYEDFAVGSEFNSRSRTITEADVVHFAGLSGDFIELHTSEEYARHGPFGRRIAHGLLTLSVSSGLMTQLNLFTGTVVAFYGIDRLRFTKPVFPGDTVRVVKRVAELVEKEKAGVITFETSVFNQQDELVLVYQDKLAVKKRADASA